MNPQMPPKLALPGVKSSIAVASGKGGVGKSTVAANLAMALRMAGNSVGLMDADIYGPSVPIMFGLGTVDQKTTAFPIEKFGIKLMSMGFMIGPEQAMIWRGPKVAQAVQAFLGQVNWGDLDYLVIDLPPGTGDAQADAGAFRTRSRPRGRRDDAGRGEPDRRPQGGEDVPRGSRADSRHRREHELLRGRGRNKTPIFGVGGGLNWLESNVPFLGELPIDPRGPVRRQRRTDGANIPIRNRQVVHVPGRDGGRDREEDEATRCRRFSRRLGSRERSGGSSSGRSRSRLALRRPSPRHFLFIVNIISNDLAFVLNSFGRSRRRLPFPHRRFTHHDRERVALQFVDPVHDLGLPLRVDERQVDLGRGLARVELVLGRFVLAHVHPFPRDRVLGDRDQTLLVGFTDHLGRRLVPAPLQFGGEVGPLNSGCPAASVGGSASCCTATRRSVRPIERSVHRSSREWCMFSLCYPAVCRRAHSQHAVAKDL